MQDGGNIVVFTGPIGAGKSTVAGEFLRISPWPFALLEGDVFWTFFDRGSHAKDWSENFKLLIRAVLGAAIPLAKGGYNALIDFSIPQTSSTRIGEHCSRHELGLHWVTLSPELDICRSRAIGRPEGRIADYRPYEDFFSGFLDSPRPVVDNSTLSPHEAATQILAGLQNDSYRLV